jgi:hypothetical protein
MRLAVHHSLAKADFLEPFTSLPHAVFLVLALATMDASQVGRQRKTNP